MRLQQAGTERETETKEELETAAGRGIAIAKATEIETESAKATEIVTERETEATLASGPEKERGERESAEIPVEISSAVPVSTVNDANTLIYFNLFLVPETAVSFFYVQIKELN